MDIRRASLLLQLEAMTALLREIIARLGVSSMTGELHHRATTTAERAELLIRQERLGQDAERFTSF